MTALRWMAEIIGFVVIDFAALAIVVTVLYSGAAFLRLKWRGLDLYFYDENRRWNNHWRRKGSRLAASQPFDHPDQLISGQGRADRTAAEELVPGNLD